MQPKKWKMLEHPPYSLNLSPCNFHMLEQLRKVLNTNRFQSDEKVQNAVKKTWSSNQNNLLSRIYIVETMGYVSSFKWQSFVNIFANTLIFSKDKFQLYSYILWRKMLKITTIGKKFRRYLSDPSFPWKTLKELSNKTKKIFISSTENPKGEIRGTSLSKFLQSSSQK